MFGQCSLQDLLDQRLGKLLQYPLGSKKIVRAVVALEDFIQDFFEKAILIPFVSIVVYSFFVTGSPSASARALVFAALRPRLPL
jgi:hypothetical protein